jgi:hypothetical protein
MTVELSGFMVDMAKAMKESPTEADLRKEVNRFLSSRKSDNRRPGIHVTDLVDPCLRRLAWKIMLPETKDPAPPPATSRIFDQGKSIHQWWQNRVYGPMGILIGKWECCGCGAVVEGKMPGERCAAQVVPSAQMGRPEQESRRCGGEWEYVEPEVNFLIDGVNVTGNSDGLLQWKGQRATLEMKGYRTENWKKIRVPDPAHIFQASTYSPTLETSQVLISYIDKETWDTKDFLVPLQPGAYAWAEDHVRTALRLVNEKRIEQAHRVCASKTAAKAVRCGFSGMLCFR